MIGKRRALNLMRRFLDGETLTSKNVRRWEIADLISMGFRVQGEQSFGDMAGAGLSHYWAPDEYSEQNKAAYEALLQSSPQEIVKHHKSDMSRLDMLEWLACVLCGEEVQPDYAIFVKTSDGRLPLCRKCAQSICNAVTLQPNTALSGHG